MTNDDWSSWVKSHTTMFGMNAEDIAMVSHWRHALDQYTLAELREASTDLLRSAPVFRNEHVSGLFKLLGRKRANQVRAFVSQRDDEYRGPRCSSCSNTGYVLVPHPQCVRDGEFIPDSNGHKATNTATCSCMVGMKKLESFDESRHKPWSLHEYETKVTMGWREMMAERAEEMKLRNTTVEGAKLADNARGPMKKGQKNKAEKPTLQIHDPIPF